MSQRECSSEWTNTFHLGVWCEHTGIHPPSRPPDKNATSSVNERDHVVGRRLPSGELRVTAQRPGRTNKRYDESTNDPERSGEKIDAVTSLPFDSVELKS